MAAPEDTKQTKYGYPLTEWEAAKAEVKAMLRDRVRANEGPISYDELARLIRTIPMEPDWYALRALLGEISNEEAADGRGMLSAYVVRGEAEEGGGMPGPGFFDLARRLGRDHADDATLWAEEVKTVEAANR
jgi:hypothetical protein